MICMEMPGFWGHRSKFKWWHGTQVVWPVTPTLFLLRRSHFFFRVAFEFILFFPFPIHIHSIDAIHHSLYEALDMDMNMHFADNSNRKFTIVLLSNLQRSLSFSVEFFLSFELICWRRCSIIAPLTQHINMIPDSEQKREKWLLPHSWSSVVRMDVFFFVVALHNNHVQRQLTPATSNCYFSVLFDLQLRLLTAHNRWHLHPHRTPSSWCLWTDLISTLCVRSSKPTIIVGEHWNYVLVHCGGNPTTGKLIKKWFANRRRSKVHSTRWIDVVVLS